MHKPDISKNKKSHKGKQTNKKSTQKKHNRSQKHKKHNILPVFNYTIPMKYDPAFRSRVENERLRNSHPLVKHIHVEKRPKKGKERRSPNGTIMLKLTLAAPNKRTADACYADGSRKIRKMMENNAKNKTTFGSRSKSKVINKSKSKSKSNNRPILVFSKSVNANTRWDEYMNEFDKFKVENPGYRVV